MNDINRLREHIDKLFAEAPPTRKAAELKEELLQNLMDKYRDLLEEGKNADAAYHIAVASIGDVSQLIGELTGAPVYTPEQERELKEYSQRKAWATAIAVALYILCPVPVILLQDTLGVLLLLLQVAAATGLLVYQNMNKPIFLTEEGTVTEEFKQWRESTSKNRQMIKAVSGVLWTVALVAYFLWSFSSGHWHISWLVFPIAGAINGIVKAVFDLRQ